MPQPLPLDAVVFDLDDTLFDDTSSFTDAARYVAACLQREYPVDENAVVAAYIEKLEAYWEGLWTADVRTAVTGLRARIWSAALTALGLDAQLGAQCARWYDEYRRERFVLWPGVAELLADLRAYGSKLAILTNGLQETHREKITILGLDDAVDRIFISDEVGMAKPDPALFTLVCRELAVAPERATMVGDRFSRDVIGAQAIGMKTLWLDFRDETPEAGAAPADVRVRDILEGAQALRASMVGLTKHR